MRVLLIEDDSAAAQSIELMLKSEGFNIYTTDLGEEGVDLGKLYDYDIILLDLDLPDMPGFDVLKQLRVSKVDTPVLILSGTTDTDIKVRGLGFGADDYLTKPFHTEELKIRIENLIETRRNIQEKFSHTSLPKNHKPIDFFSEIDDNFLRRLTVLIDSHLDDESLSIEDLSKKVAMSRSQIHRKLKALTGQSATGFLRSYRLDRGMELLKNKEGNVQQVSIRVGFGSQQYFAKRFKEKFGISPSEA